MPDSLGTDWSAVAQQALDMGERGILSLVELAQETAPVAWEIMVRQVYVDAILLLLFPTSFVVLFGAARYLLPRWIDEPQKYFENNYGKHTRDAWTTWDTCTHIVPAVLCAASCIAVAICASIAAGRFINPEYYALQKLISLASGGQ